MAKKTKRPVPQSREEANIKSFLDMIAPSVVSFMPDHFICGNTYRCVWALREYPTSTDEQAILRHLGEKDGITLRIYTRQVTPTEEKRIIQNAAKDKYGSNILVDFDQRDEDKTSANILILGNSGQGKSYLMKLLILNLLESGKSVITLDAEHEQQEMCEAVGGCFADLMAGQYIINVLEPKCWDDGGDPNATDAPEAFRKSTLLAQHISFLKDFFRAYKDFSDAHIDTIEIMLSKLYQKFGITERTNFSRMRPTDYPILSDLYDLIEEEYKTYDTSRHQLYTEKLLQEVLLGLHSMCKGADAQFFNGHTNITSSRFLVFGVKGMLSAAKNVRNAMLFNVLSFMSDKLLTVGNTVAALDELYIWLSNAFFYDAAEGLLTSVILMLAEFLPPDEKHPQERRHIVSVFKLVQDLLEPSRTKNKSHFQVLMSKLPPDHKAKWFAGAALNSADQAMASVMSTVLSRLNAFLDSELEQILCFDSAIDAEKFASEKSAIFLILPEEDTTKNFMAGLMIQNLSRELFAVADENGGKLKNRVVLYCDEFGTMPPFDILSLFSAGRSRRLTLVPIIQSLAQLEKNYGKEGCEIIQDNCQDTIFGGFAPNSQTAEVLSKALGSRTVLSGSVSRGKNDPSQSLQMMERALLTPDELKSIPKGSFIVMKTGTHPMRTRLQLFLNWGITFGEPYTVPERANRAVAYANRMDLERNLPQSSKAEDVDESRAYAVSGHGGMAHDPVQEKPRKRGRSIKTMEEDNA